MIVASPTYKATYTGLLKLFLDRIAGGALAGVTAVPVMLGGHWRHSLRRTCCSSRCSSSSAPPARPADCSCSTRDYAESGELDTWLQAARPQLAALVEVSRP